jgi:hypothetical protein
MTTTTYTVTSQDRCDCSALRYMHNACFYIAGTSDNQLSNELMEDFIFFTIWATTAAKTVKETLNVSPILQAQRSFQTELSRHSRSAPPTVKKNLREQLQKLQDSTQIAYLKANFLRITTTWVNQHSVTLSRINTLPHEDDNELGRIARSEVLSQSLPKKNPPAKNRSNKPPENSKQWTWINNFHSRPAPTSTSPRTHPLYQSQ